MFRNVLFTAVLSVCTLLSVLGQRPEKPTSSEIYHDLQKLNFFGTALYIAAHPDDENTRLISWLSNDQKARTAYLSLTRGDGGQNLIGPEIRELLGIIRTQELLAARRTDGGQQFFSRANDFGYSKHPDETLDIWEKDQVLSDVVRTIRQFKPDIIINRFDHRSPGRTHGHHTSSAMLSMEAFDLVNNAGAYPETAKVFGTWQPKRLFFNTSWWFYGSREKFEEADKTNLVELQTGSYYPSLGLSNGEIAALSRSMHKSQGFGSSGTRGSMNEWLEFLKGDRPTDKSNLWDGIDTNWSRVEGGEAIGKLLDPLEENFDFTNPESALPVLLQAYELIKSLEDDHWRTIKQEQIEQLIINCSGLFLEVTANTNSINPGASFDVTIEAVNRSAYPMQLVNITKQDGSLMLGEAVALNSNQRFTTSHNIVSQNKSTSNPYWLNERGTLGMYQAPSEMIGKPENDPAEHLVFDIKIGESLFSVSRDIVYKYTDPVKGEVYQPLEVLPEITTSIKDKVLIFPGSEQREVRVEVRAGRDNVSGTVQLNHPEGWKVNPATQTFELNKKGESVYKTFVVSPPNGQSEGYLKPLASMGSKFFDKELITIDYDHIPYQRVLLPSEAKVVRIDIEKKGSLIGYIEGAGDAIPESLRYIGYDVQTIPPDEISSEKLKTYDAIVVGIRAYNTVPELAFKQDMLNEYVKEGGVLLLQYNTSRRLVSDQLGPYSLQLSRDRVTDENSEVSIIKPQHPVFNSPNKITTSDFDGWVQERGLYFPSSWDDAFTPLLRMKDNGSNETEGALLVAEYGKGHYIYTGLSFFRELPAGVPGAYRLFANLLSLGN